VTEMVILTTEDLVAEICFNRPAVLNAPNIETAELFEDLVNRAVAQKSHVLIISGAGRAFMAGGDLGAFRDTVPEERSSLSRRIIEPINRALEALTASNLITVASVHGAVAGAGMSLAMMADLAVAAESTRFSFAYTKVGVSPDCGGSFALARLVGLRRALEIALLSETIDAKRALEWGLVNRVVPDKDLRDATMQFAQRLSQGPRESLGSTKQLLRKAGSALLTEQLRAELEQFAELSAAPNFQEGLDAFFEKRVPRFTD
jgi:2-(1,2-epoxy-1,2-dihydrophenyl)acetyl-CoA isomerase